MASILARLIATYGMKLGKAYLALLTTAGVTVSQLEKNRNAENKVSDLPNPELDPDWAAKYKAAVEKSKNPPAPRSDVYNPYITSLNPNGDAMYPGEIPGNDIPHKPMPNRPWRPYDAPFDDAAVSQIEADVAESAQGGSYYYNPYSTDSNYYRSQSVRRKERNRVKNKNIKNTRNKNKVHIAY